MQRQSQSAGFQPWYRYQPQQTSRPDSTVLVAVTSYLSIMERASFQDIDDFMTMTSILEASIDLVKQQVESIKRKLDTRTSRRVWTRGKRLSNKGGKMRKTIAAAIECWAR